MTRTSLLIVLAATAALAGCNKENHTIVAGPDGDSGNDVTANANIQLPPSIIGTKIYRCADNVVVTVDYLSDNKSANVRVGKDGSPVQVVSAQPGQPMTAPGGYEITGSPTGSTAKIAVPGHSSQSCKA
jgi:hypothetical protein